MSVLQYSFFLRPASVLPQEIRGRLDKLETLHGKDISDFESWRKVQPPSDFSDQLSRLLPERPHWSQNARRWGYENRDRIEVWFKHGQVREVGARIFVYELNESFERRIVGLTKRWDCFIAEEYGLGVFRAELLHTLLMLSPSKKYADDLRKNCP